MSSKNIVKLLMRRDGISELEAQNWVDEVREEIQEAAARGAYEECEDILRCDLGIEPDYLMDLLWE